jgi:hypothetical protein
MPFELGAGQRNSNFVNVMQRTVVSVASCQRPAVVGQEFLWHAILDQVEKWALRIDEAPFASYGFAIIASLRRELASKRVSGRVESESGCQRGLDNFSLARADREPKD